MSCGVIIRALELSHYQRRWFQGSGSGSQGMTTFESPKEKEKEVPKHLRATYSSVYIKPEGKRARVRKPQWSIKVK